MAPPCANAVAQQKAKQQKPVIIGLIRIDLLLSEKSEASTMQGRRFDKKPCNHARLVISLTT